nr:ribonuclease H-like domain-containing protein [Tanacetum cinerariifolium]
MHEPPPLDFVPEPIYLEFIPPEDDVFPAEEQPLPTAVSPTTDSLGYITESDPDEDLEEEDDEDLEEDPADYPTNRDDDDDEEEEERFHARTPRLIRISREAWAQSMVGSDMARFEIRSLRTTKMPLRKAPRTRTTLATATTTTLMTDAAIWALISRGVADALAEHEIQRNYNLNGDGSQGSGSGIARHVRLTRECTYTDFLKCQPMNLKVQNQVKFATCTLHGVGLTWWKSHVKTVGHDAAYGVPWNTIMKMMTANYTQRSQELALLYERMFPEESDTIEMYVGGLPDMIHGSVMASKTNIMQDAVEFATELMDKKIRTFAERQIENKRKQADNQQQQNKSTLYSLKETDLESTQNNAVAKLPLLKQGDYEMWKLRIEQYFQVQDYALWDVIENGNSFKPVPRTIANVDGTSTSTIPGPVTTEEKTQKKNDVKARSMLLMALHNEHLLTFSQYKDAKTLFEAIQARFGGNNATKKTQKTLRSRCENISQEDLNMMFLRSLPSEWNTLCTNEVDTATIQVSTVSTSISTISSHDNTANLSDATVYAFLANQPNESRLVHEDLEQIHEDDMEEMYLKWKCRSLRNQESRPRNQDSSIKTVNVEDTSSKEMVVIDGAGFDRSYMADDKAPTNMVLMAFSDSKEFQHHEFKGYGPKDSKSVCVDTSNEIKKDLDAPTIKDWVSDSDYDESEIM